jgi:acetyl-CoA acetyltransferase
VTTVPCAIVGIGQSEYGRETGKTSLRLHYDAAAAALADAGLSFADVDGLFSCAITGGLHGNLLPEYLGITPAFVDSTSLGGGTWESFVEHACAAISAGRCEVALLVYGSAQRTEFGSKLGTGLRVGASGPAQYYSPHGVTVVGAYAMAAQRYMAQYGVTSEQLAEVAVTMRRNAGRNPGAMYRTPITVDDVLASRMIADPLHMLDCCVVTDGGGAVVITSAERARDLPRRPVYIKGAASAFSHDSIVQMADMTSLVPAAQAAERALSVAGMSIDDIDLLQVYDSYTITVLLTLEALGLCKPGEAGDFVAGGRLAYDGVLPTNTDGGGLSSNHPGMRGIFLLIEATQQLRGSAGPWQVERPLTTALCNGTGGQLSACSTVVLSVEE